jgi:hypothetical protein
MKNLNRAISLIVFLVFSLVGSSVYGVDDRYARESLRGITGTGILIEPLGPELKGAGLTVDQLKADVESKLKSAGIKIINEKDILAETGNPYLHLMTGVLKTNKQYYVYAVTADFCQDATLTRNKLSAMFTTWSIGGYGLTDNLGEIRNIAKDIIDQFINAWLSVNPKK